MQDEIGSDHVPFESRNSLFAEDCPNKKIQLIKKINVKNNFGYFMTRLKLQQKNFVQRAQGKGGSLLFFLCSLREISLLEKLGSFIRLIQQTHINSILSRNTFNGTFDMRSI